jgi:hypothetical protein
VLPISLSSTITGTKTLAGKTYTTVTHLSPIRKATLLATAIVILALLGFGLFSLIQTGPSVAIPYPPNSGSLALNDLLQNNNGGNGWPDATNSNGSACQFMQNAYHVSMTQIGSFHYCIADSPDFSNFAYEVRMVISQGDGGGVIFRANGTQNKFYYFRIGRDGSYGLDLYSDSTHVRTLASGVTPAAHTGLNVPNLLAVVARGGTIDLYVNNQRITSVNDSTYGSGQIGVGAASSTGLTEVVFSNARVWTL